MKKLIKNLLKRFIAGFLSWLPRTLLGQHIYEQIIIAAMNQKKVINYHSQQMTFTIPNGLNQYRISTFASKEPETLDWIDAIPEGSVLWDVGANIGLYTIYAAKARNCHVFAFEPSVFNLELLARNIFINSLQRQVSIVPIALSDKVGSNMFKMSNTNLGGALSTFGESFDQNGNIMNEVFEYQTIGVSMNDAVRLLEIPTPNYIKIDVDGIEHFILRGGANVLNKVDSVLIEINDDFVSQAQQTIQHLTNAGLSLHRKCAMGGGSNQYNQWWVRGKTTLNRN
jgi:FkbM family methyltransferase